MEFFFSSWHYWCWFGFSYFGVTNCGKKENKRKKTKEQKYWKWNFRVHILKHIEWDQSRNLNDIWSRVSTYFLRYKANISKAKARTSAEMDGTLKIDHEGKGGLKTHYIFTETKFFLFEIYEKTFLCIPKLKNFWYLSCPCKNLAFKNKVLGNSKKKFWPLIENILMCTFKLFHGPSLYYPSLGCNLGPF